MELIDMKENPQNIAWTGPDCLNVLGITTTTLEEQPYIKDCLHDGYEKYLKNYPYEMALRESSYFHNIYSNLIKEAQPFDQRWLMPTLDTFQEYRNIRVFEENGFACLKHQKMNFLMKKTFMIIGRTTRVKNDNVTWEVDLDLQDNPKVSKQHALIAFNFDKMTFEIACLSRKNTIQVNKKTLKPHDPPYILQNEALIDIGGEKFYFFLPKNRA